MRALFLLLFATHVIAAPLSLSAYPSGPACLAVLLTITVTMTTLFALKLIFMRRRRLVKALPSWSSSPNASTKLDASYSTGSQYQPAWSLSSKTPPRVRNGGVWVGFFGSPRSETRFDIQTNNCLGQSLYYVWEFSKHSRRYRNSISRGSMVSIGKSGLPVSTVVESRALYNLRDGTKHGRPRSLRLPSHPTKAYTKTPKPRRFSAPADSRSSSRADSLKKRRHTSLKSVRSSRSDTSGLNFGNSSLRLVHPHFHAEPPLPLPPRARRTPNLPPLPALPISGPFFALQHRFPISPRSGKRPALPADSLIEGLPQTAQISHPYALLPVKSGNPRRLSKIPQIPLDMTCPDFSPFSSPATFGVHHSPSPAQATYGAVHGLPPIPPHPTPGVPTFPYPVPPGPGVGIPLQKPRSITPRARKSPVIGPSPLRVMTLPEGPSSDSVGANKCPDGRLKPSQEQRPGEDSSIRPLSSFKGADEDEAALLGIIQELIEETSDWDPDLFMDAGFKTLLHDTSLKASSVSLCVFEEGNVSQGSSSGPEPSSGSSNHSGSDEMDLGLLGIEFSPTRKTKATPPRAKPAASSDAHSNSLKKDGLVSFWDEKGWEKSFAPPVDRVGLAV
ncbi:hypothetical protein BDN71DRAFT_1450995 [Pleurotus eryngii]|uniref:Uncharacterized protein n=1 Tax=Pleurotus eryngii TaxID=5323 RepID=A0A9P5ZW20_PLEER|nr:hypothetical protein BDN71DRAFT_1450995 [Pleurotus eryngii]